MIIVSNTSPLIALSAIGRFGLLRDLYGEIWIPESVHQEVLGTTPDRPGVVEIQAPWVRSRPVASDFLLRALTGELDRGEAEAIALGLDLQADLLLMDERRGRKVAGRFGLRVLGVLGILAEAKKHGLVPAIEPLLEDLLTIAGFRISAALYLRVLAEAGEHP